MVGVDEVGVETVGVEGVGVEGAGVDVVVHGELVKGSLEGGGGSEGWSEVLPRVHACLESDYDSTQMLCICYWRTRRTMRRPVHNSSGMWRPSVEAVEGLL